jgi:hypothetical protein
MTPRLHPPTVEDLTDNRVELIFACVNSCGTEVLLSLPDHEDLVLAPRRAARLGLDIARAAIDAMDVQQLEELLLDAKGLMDFIHDYGRALHACPRCGDGPYPEEPFDPPVRVPTPPAEKGNR